MTTMKDDTISRAAAIDAFLTELTKRERKNFLHTWSTVEVKYFVADMLEKLPSAQPEPEEFEWCHTCREYDQEKHCCHRWTKVIRKTVDDMKAAQPGWILWDSGRFPEESGTYTVTAYDGAKRRVTYAKYQKRLKRWELTGARAYWRVLAWQPQLQPWEGGQDE